MSSTPEQNWYASPRAVEEEEFVPAELVPTTVEEAPQRRIPLLPVVLFLITCMTTYQSQGGGLKALAYSVPVMLILLCHEFGHYIQARRYRVPASLPYFIPMPIGPIGTMGAVISMSGRMPNRKALFDIGISGPLAGMGPALICTVLGLLWSHVERIPPGFGGRLGDPLLFRVLVNWIFGELPAGHDVFLHPLAFAGWVGVFLTALNLVPIGQLDGGHVLYAMLRGKARIIAWVLFAGAIIGMAVTRNYGWSVMLILLYMMGPSHPPTVNDREPLGTGRVVLGWLTLAFLIIGFTPTPFIN